MFFFLAKIHIFFLTGLYVQGQVMSDSTSEELYDATQNFMGGGQAKYCQYYSDDNSQHHTNPLPDFSNQTLNIQTPLSLRTWLDISPSPGRRFGLGPEFGTSIIPPNVDHHEPNTTLDHNFPPIQNQPRPIPNTQPSTQAHPTPTNTNIHSVSEPTRQQFGVSRLVSSTWA